MILPISLVFTGNSVLVIVHAAAGLALVIYVPAAIILSAKNSWNQFDHAGGEVAYIVIQMLAWLSKSHISPSATPPPPPSPSPTNGLRRGYCEDLAADAS